MCEPTTLAIISLGLTAASGYVAYKSSKDAQAYNDELTKQGKSNAEAQALDAQRLGQIERSERRLKTRMQLATQQVGFGAQNVETTGTALDILGDTAIFGEVDENRITANADRKAFGFKYQAYELEANNRLQKFQSKNDRTGILLTTASSAFGTFGTAKAAGAFGTGASTKAAGSGLGGAGMGRGVGGPR